MSQIPPTVEISEHDLPLHCPTDKMALWSAHPRVFLDVKDDGSAMCPYCSTRYKLPEGTVLKGHH